MVRIRYSSLKVGDVSNSSSLNTGDNLIIGRTEESKINEGFGVIRGRGNRAKSNTQAVNDNDIKDVTSS